MAVSALCGSQFNSRLTGKGKSVEGKMSYGVCLLLAAVILFCCPVLATAQERPRTVRQESNQRSNRHAVSYPDDVVRIRTRAVFIDALVKDRRTNEPVRDLKPEDFQVLDDGKPRKLSYFTKEGDTRRPLALLLFIDLWTQYGRAHLKSQDAMQRLASALTKLAPEDEVAVMVTWIEEGDVPGTPLPKVKVVEGFTRDRAKTTAALLSVPALIADQERQVEEIARSRTQLSEDLETISKLTKRGGGDTRATHTLVESVPGNSMTSYRIAPISLDTLTAKPVSAPQPICVLDTSSHLAHQAFLLLSFARVRCSYDLRPPDVLLDCHKLYPSTDAVALLQLA